MQGGIQRVSSKENMTTTTTTATLKTKNQSQEIRIIDSKAAIVEKTAPEMPTKAAEPIFEPSKQSWKVKAIIDNRNFLIPVP